MKFAPIILLCSSILLLHGCYTIPPKTRAPNSQVIANTEKISQCAKCTEHIIGQQYVNYNHRADEQNLTGQRSTPGRVLAAGGYIAGAIGGS